MLNASRRHEHLEHTVSSRAYASNTSAGWLGRILQLPSVNFICID
jgi:hypothetical protein